MSGVTRILVAVDFSTTSDTALDYAVLLAQRLDAGLHVLHVVEERSVVAIEEAQRCLVSCLDRCVHAKVKATTQVNYGNPSGVIVQQAAQRGADMIVMGTHGRTGLIHLRLGSVAERVVRIAPCPVVTVRPTNRVADLLATTSAEQARKDVDPMAIST